MCYCGNTGYRNKSQHRKLTLEKKIARRSCRDSNPRPFNHESGALTTELSLCFCCRITHTVKVPNATKKKLYYKVSIRDAAKVKVDIIEEVMT